MGKVFETSSTAVVRKRHFFISPSEIVSAIVCVGLAIISGFSLFSIIRGPSGNAASQAEVYFYEVTVVDPSGKYSTQVREYKYGNFFRLTDFAAPLHSAFLGYARTAIGSVPEDLLASKEVPAQNITYYMQWAEWYWMPEKPTDAGEDIYVRYYPETDAQLSLEVTQRFEGFQYMDVNTRSLFTLQHLEGVRPDNKNGNYFAFDKWKTSDGRLFRDGESVNLQKLIADGCYQTLILDPNGAITVSSNSGRIIKLITFHAVWSARKIVSTQAG